MIRAILFELNGVIINDAPLQLSAFRDAFRTFSIELTDHDYHESIGMDDVTLVRTFLRTPGRTDNTEVEQKVMEQKRAGYAEMISDELPVFCGAVDFIKAVGRRMPLAIVSMASRREIDDVLERLGIKETFSSVISAEDVPVCKPHPYCYKLGRRRLNETQIQRGLYPLGFGDCLAIEHSPAGILSARIAGMRTLGITNTVHERDLRAAGAEVVSGSLSDWTPDAVHHVFS